MSVELKLVLEIEKYRCLYNFNLAEYFRKDITEKAWGEVAAKTELSVNDCKEKWRNIRSSFLRSMKAPPSGPKTKKPYYLKDYLQFILPYVKTLNNVVNSGNVPQSETEILADAEVGVESSNDESQSMDDHNTQVEDIIPADPLSTQSQLPPTVIRRRRRKRPVPEVEETFIDYLKNKSKRRQAEETIQQHSRNDPMTADNNPMRYFLMSLLPEFESMTEDQIRSFKIRVMILIDEIKSSYSQFRRIPYYSATSVSYPEPSHKIPFEESSSHSSISSVMSPDPLNSFSPINYPSESPTPQTEPGTEQYESIHNEDSKAEVDVKVGVYSYLNDLNKN